MVGNITIGDNAIIAANAAVVKDVRENEVVGGVPAKTIGEIVFWRERRHTEMML